MDNIKYYIGIGRRKTATASVFLKEGSGKSEINKKNLTDYFYMEPSLCKSIYHPLRLFNKEKEYDLLVRVKGGGFHSQAEAIILALSHALLKIFPEYRATLKSFSLLKKDPRKNERKKIGHKKSRKSSQFSKR